MPISLDRRVPLAVLSLLAVLVALAWAVGAAGPAAAQPVAAAQVEEGEEELEDEEELTDEELEAIDEEFDALEDEAGFDEAAGPDEQVLPIQRATGELGRAKRAAAAKVARLSSAAALGPCMRGGPGWKRIRAIEHASQRNLYAASARKLLADMKLLLDRQQPQIAAFEPAFERFVDQLRAAPVDDATLRAAIAAQGRRLASYRDVARLRANCKVFNKLTRRVREFPTRTAAQIVRADYRAAPIARRIERHLSHALRRIDRRHGIDHRDAETLADAADRLVELGGEPGYATGFQYALSLR